MNKLVHYYFHLIEWEVHALWVYCVLFMSRFCRAVWWSRWDLKNRYFPVKVTAARRTEATPWQELLLHSGRDRWTKLQENYLLLNLFPLTRRNRDSPQVTDQEKCVHRSLHQPASYLRPCSQHTPPDATPLRIFQHPFTVTSKQNH